MSATQKLRELIDAPELLICPGVYDGISTNLAINLGAKAMYMTGAGTVAGRLGLPDVGLAGLTDMAGNAMLCANVDPTVPLIADADTGYGNSVSCARTLATYARIGVSALHIEDQVLNKRCGHLLGKQIVPLEEYLSRIRAMVFERKRLNADILIISRTDSLQSYGVDEAIKRCKAAVEIGADIAFVEGITSREEAEKVIKELSPTPCLINMVPGGATPQWTFKELHEIGFKLAIFPGAALGPAASAIEESYKAILHDGVDSSATLTLSPKDLFTKLGLAKVIALDKAAGGTTFENGA